MTKLLLALVASIEVDGLSMWVDLSCFHDVAA
jgi:hypothetical protein